MAEPWSDWSDPDNPVGALLMDLGSDVLVVGSLDEYLAWQLANPGVTSSIRVSPGRQVYARRIKRVAVLPSGEGGVGSDWWHRQVLTRFGKAGLVMFDG